MTALVARTGRHQQRYEHGHRLIAGCVDMLVEVYIHDCFSMKESRKKNVAT